MLPLRPLCLSVSLHFDKIRQNSTCYDNGTSFSLKVMCHCQRLVMQTSIPNLRLCLYYIEPCRKCKTNRVINGDIIGILLQIRLMGLLCAFGVPTPFAFCFMHRIHCNIHRELVLLHLISLFSIMLFRTAYNSAASTMHSSTPFSPKQRNRRTFTQCHVSIIENTL